MSDMSNLKAVLVAAIAEWSELVATVVCIGLFSLIAGGVIYYLIADMWGEL